MMELRRANRVGQRDRTEAVVASEFTRNFGHSGLPPPHKREQAAIDTGGNHGRNTLDRRQYQLESFFT